MPTPHRHITRPIAFILSYVRRRPLSHLAILAAVLGAVACATGTQYGIKALVDTLSSAPGAMSIWGAFALLVFLIAADNLLWRIAGWTSCPTFVGVTGDLRRDLFRHLTGHSPAYFSDRGAGTLSSRITAASNAIYTIESLFVWNVLPPLVATLASIALVATISVPVAGGLTALAGIMVVVMFRMAAAGWRLHHDFADKAAAIDGELVDVISNISLVRAFGGRRREHRRFDAVVDRELNARQRSLWYLEKLRVLHAVFTILLTVGLLAWAILRWQAGLATTGDVILVCTLGLTVLHATRDLAVALVDATQHVARLAEALPTLLVPHDLLDDPEAAPLIKRGARLSFKRVSFQYPDGRRVFANFNLDVEPGQRVGLLGQSGAGKSTLFALIQRFYELQGGQVLIDGQDIARVTRDSLQDMIAIVPQDVLMFQRSVMENIRYGKPEASDETVLAAADMAGCRFIQELPDGFDTLVGAQGVKLSGGQRQRIAIARAFLKDAPLLLLDEATSSLDIESEEAVREALDRLMRERTVIAIAHRLSTIRGFDRIVVLSGGKVMEEGAPDRLVRRDGPYRRLIRGELARLSPNAA